MARKPARTTTQPNNGANGGKGRRARNKKGAGGSDFSAAVNRGPQGAPVAVGSTLTNRDPRTTPTAGGNIRVRNSEFVNDVTSGPQGSNIYGFDLNPMAGNVFTWLPRIAAGYELFRFNKLRFIYTPMCSSSVAGVVVGGYDYDATDAAPATKQALSAYSDAKRSNVWSSVTVDLRPPSGWFYVGEAGLSINPIGTDIKFYDVAKFYFGIFNAPLNTVVGELSVEYDVEFSKPDFSSSLVPLSGLTTVSGGTYAAPMGTTQATSGNIAVTFANIGNGQFTMTFKQPAQLLMELVAAITTASAQTQNMFIATQNDPGVLDDGVPTFVDFNNSAWPSATLPFTALSLLTAQVLAGTVITVTFIGAATSGYMARIRFGTYQKTLG